MKYLIFALLGAAVIIGISTQVKAEPFYLHVAKPMVMLQDVKVFHKNTAVDNGDSCTTPEELAGYLQGKGEIRNQISGDDAVKLKNELKKEYPGTTDEQLQWDEIDAYLTTDPNSGEPAMSIILFKKDETGTLCIVGGGYMQVADWDKLMIDSGIAPKASTIRLGHEGNPEKMRSHQGHIN